MFEIIRTEGHARRGRFRCAHGGEVQTPVFMNVGTQGAIKGALSAHDLKDIKCQIELSNTYHRGGGHLRLPHRRTAHLHGARGVHADPGQLGQ